MGYDGGELVQVVDHSREGLLLGWTLCGKHVSDSFDLRSSALNPSRVHVNPKNDFWSTLNWNLCCVKDIEYVLVMLHFTLAIDKSIVSNSTQVIKFSKYRVHFLLKHIFTGGKSEWQPFPPVFAPWGTESAQFAPFVIEFYLPESTVGVQDSKVGGSTDLGYHIIYDSHIVGDTLDGLIEIAAVQEQANCAIGLSCDIGGVDPWRVLIVYWQ